MSDRKSKLEYIVMDKPLYQKTQKEYEQNLRE